MKEVGSKWFHAHAHSEFSCKDAIQRVPDMVDRAVGWGQPAVALTDHGNMSGTVQLYQAGKQHGVQVFPGFEGYLVEDHTDKEAKRHHFGLLSTDLPGYRALAAFSSLSHTRPRFHIFPRHDLADLAGLAGQDDARRLVLLTGCYFGLVQQTLVTKGFDAARAVVEMYVGWFPNTVVEIQNHAIDHPDGWTDDTIVEALVDIAAEVGVPVMATQDSHYLKPGDKAAHDTMKKMVFRNGDTNEFPGDSFHFASTEWVKRHYTREQWEKVEEGAAFILGKHDLEMPALDSFKAFVPKMSRTPEQDLRDKVYTGLQSVVGKQRLEGYKDRLLYELGIINKLGYANYFLHVLDIVEFCKRKKIVIETRGSGNASLVCFCLGITQADPIQWDLTFERFMSLDRQKPPDIDLDVEDERRGEILAYIRNKYGAVTIGNYGSLGSRDEDDKGSVLVTYNSFLRSIMSPAAFNQRFGKGIERIADIRSHNKKDYRGIRRLSKAAARKSYGTHASGLLLPGGHMKLEDYVPTMLVASSNTTVTQFTMDDIEKLGYLKDDILGQRTLWVMARCQELMGRGTKDDFSWIPLDDPETCTFLSKGILNNAVFQFEGYAMGKGARTMGIRNTRDCIIAAALFRPACIDSGVTDTYLKRRKNKALRANVRYPHPAFEAALKSTYGCPLFQEQVLQIMRGLGLDYAGINMFFKIVKDSGKGAVGRNQDRLKEVRQRWEAICKENGISDVDGAWHYIEGYTGYSFNLAHATGYGIRSYRAAYLKTHYPLEYMTAALQSVAGKNTKPDKEVLYVQEARRMGLKVLPPDIAVSGAKWTMDPRRRAITKGLGSVKGVSVERAEQIVAGRPEGGWQDARELAEAFPAGVLSGRNQYLDLADGKTRVNKATGEVVPRGAWIGTMKALKEAGALVSLGVGKED